MKYIIIFISILFVSSTIFAQEKNDWRLFPGKNKTESAVNLQNKKDSTSNTLDYSNIDGEINIIQPKSIDSLTSKHKRNPYILGYTVQLEVSQQSSKIRDARYKLLKIQPDAPIEENYAAPNTYLYGGSFYTRTDAYEFKNAINSSFPNAIVISRKLALPTIEKK